MKSTNINAIKIIRSLRRRMLDTLNSSFKTYYRCPCNKTMIPNNSKQFQSTGSHLDVPATSDIFTPQVHKPDSNTELAVSTNARTEEKLDWLPRRFKNIQISQYNKRP
jgi:phosphoribosylformylglycinamidine (FGAM) synthase-like amidotransferase family enzyme